MHSLTEKKPLQTVVGPEYAFKFPNISTIYPKNEKDQKKS